MSKNLYFIAIIPPPAVANEITGFKEELAEKFNVRHALKAPPHITLQMPFKRPSFYEQKLEAFLEKFVENESPIPVKMSGFDTFEPRVIFVAIENHQPLVQLHDRLQKSLSQHLHFTLSELDRQFHPHCTIATRDLHKKVFHPAWKHIKERPYSSEFVAESLFILKHNGKHWNVLKQFFFKAKKL